MREEINWDAELFVSCLKFCKARIRRIQIKILYDWLKKFPFEEKTDKKAEEYLTYPQKDNERAESKWIYDEQFYSIKMLNYLQKVVQDIYQGEKNAYAFL